MGYDGRAARPRSYDGRADPPQAVRAATRTCTCDAQRPHTGANRAHRARAATFLWSPGRRGPQRPGPEAAADTAPIDSGPMEAFFIALMAAVVVLTGYVSLVVLYKLLKADNS